MTLEKFGLCQCGCFGSNAHSRPSRLVAIFGQEGPQWRFACENAVGQDTHCEQPVEWKGRRRYRTGWKPAWRRDEHAEGLVGAKGITETKC
jgi:hypothetical protein